jgi:succinoglycan biosynthesis transport protein ExoP
MPAKDANSKSLPAPRPDGASSAAPGTFSGALIPWSLGDKPTGPAALSAAPTASALLQSLRRRWPTALVLATLGAAAAVALVMLVMPGQYTASALLEVSSRSPIHFLGEGDQQPDPIAVKENNKAIILSPNVLNKALNSKQAQALAAVRDEFESADRLAKALKVDFKGPEMVEIKLSSQDPETAQKLVNAVADEYRQFVNKQETAKLKVLIDQLVNNYKEGEGSLHEKQRLLHDILRRNDQDDPEAGRSRYDSAMRQLEDAKKEARVLGGEEIRLQSELKGQKEELANLPLRGVPDVIVDKYLQDDVGFKQHLTELGKIDDEVRKIRATYNDDAAGPFLDSAARQREAVLKSLAAYRKAQMPRVVEVYRAEATVAVSKLERELAGVRSRQVFTRGEIGRLDAEARRLAPGNRLGSPDAEALRQEVKLKEDVLTKLGERIETLKAAPALATQVTLVQRAELPETLDRARQIKVAGAAGAGAFGLILLLVGLWEFRTRKINAAREVVDGLGLSLVGTLPALPARARRALAGPASRQDQEFHGQLNESVDAIRTLLLHAARTEDLQVVMVTSAAAGEGKTSVASQLAASLARAWRKTLLIDGDLRHPGIHKLFEQALEPGFSEVLRGEVEATDAIQPTALSRLWVMPAGHWDSHAVQALAQESVRSLFEQLKGQYDFIVVDSCPVLPVADSLLLGQHVDAVLFSILRDVSRAPAIHAAQQRLAGLGIRTLGAVMIGAAAEVPGDRYQYSGKAQS